MNDPTPVGLTIDEDIEGRRQKVMSMKLRLMSMVAIAQALNVTVATVSRDVQWIREHWRGQYGAAPILDPGELVGEAIALYREVERAALLEYNRLATAPATASVVRSRLMALEVAAKQRERHTTLLMDIGVVERALGTVRTISQVPRAAELRRAIQDARVTDEMLRPEPVDPAA